MTVIENIKIAYVSQDLSLLSSTDADGTKDLRYLSIFAIGCMILPLREDRRKCLFNGWVNFFLVFPLLNSFTELRQISNVLFRETRASCIILNKHCVYCVDL